MTPTSRLRALLLAALPALALTAACGDTLAPGALEGRRYALQRTGNDRLPITLSAYPRDTTQLLADTIVFGTLPHATRVLTYRYAWGDSAPRRLTYRVELEFRVQDDQVEVGWFTPCGPTALCAPNLIGAASASELRLVPNNGIPSPTSHYVRSDVAL